MSYSRETALVEAAGQALAVAPAEGCQPLRPASPPSIGAFLCEETGTGNYPGWQGAPGGSQEACLLVALTSLLRCVCWHRAPVNERKCLCLGHWCPGPKPRSFPGSSPWCHHQGDQLGSLSKARLRSFPSLKVNPSLPPAPAVGGSHMTAPRVSRYRGLAAPMACFGG